MLVAQAPGVERFEVASIKRNRSVERGIGGGGLRDTYCRTNATLLSILLEGYDRRFLRFEVIGGPDWLDRDKFDVVAKTDGRRCDMDRPARQAGPKLKQSPTTVEEDLKLPQDQRRCRSDSRAARPPI